MNVTRLLPLSSVQSEPMHEALIWLLTLIVPPAAGDGTPTIETVGTKFAMHDADAVGFVNVSNALLGLDGQPVQLSKRYPDAATGVNVTLLLPLSSSHVEPLHVPFVRLLTLIEPPNAGAGVPWIVTVGVKLATQVVVVVAFVTVTDALVDVEQLDQPENR